MKKFLIVAHNIRFVVQFVMNDISLLQGMGYEVHCAVNYQEDHVINDAVDILEKAGVVIHQIDCARSPLRVIKNTKALHQLVKLIRREKFEGLHCHTPIGGVLGRVGGKLGGVNRIFYTAHGFHFFKGSSIQSWLLYFPVEWICSFMTDVLITINHEDYSFASEHMHAKKVEWIPGVGVDLTRFHPAVEGEENNRRILREKLGIPEDAVMLLSVGEVNDNKNHRVVMDAMARLNDPQIYYVICGRGPLETEHGAYCRDLGIEKNVLMAGYQEKIEDFYRAADITLFPSKREGLGLAAVEGMACGVPLIASDTRGSREYCVDHENALVCHWNNAEEFAAAINELLQNGKLYAEVIANGQETAKNFGSKISIGKMQKIYSVLLSQGNSNDDESN